uniref:uncharacterized protein LOC122594859 isoform X2 n=1 Tax=Erigeron canadensis TaxID=72917 RepID=UPI001CB89C90|nr:uncharacterized protein LOC122594859 isoform X2 [Erigeron canadensis]
MKTLISISNPISFPQWTKYIPSVPSLHHHYHNFTNNEKPIFFNFRITRLYKTTSFSSYSAEYNGWVDPGPVNSPTESTHLNKLLTSLGIDDKKYAFVYLFGFVCALAVSRIRVSSIIVFPACFIVFAIGFSFGVVNNGGFVKKKRVKDVKFETLSDLLSGFDVKILELRDSIRRNIECGKISKKDLVGYAEGLEFVEESVLEVKRLVDGMVVDGNDVSKGKGNGNGKGKGKGFDVLGFINGVRERSFGSRGSKVKDGVKNDLRYKEVSDRDQGIYVDPVVEDEMEKSVTSDGDVRVKETYTGKGIGRFMEMETGAKQVFERDERFMSNGNLDDDFLDIDFGASYKNGRRREELFQQERGNFKKIDEKNILYDNMEPTEEEGYDKSRNKNGFASSPSSDISSDIIFSDYITEANALSKQVRELLKHSGIEEDAENMLYKSTELLSKAVDMKPMSLLAVGQLGNTYLLHGELKLKLSRKLRALLAQSDSNERLHDEVSNREQFVDYLVNVCEECEELLVNAGRKYRLALSIDADDMRALYNWGLALSFRAQLIADIGPEAAFDADKVYLAAIDKFDAMMSKSNAHTPDALFRWGVALQQRSRLRTRNFREKVKLLSQAKRLYEDALLMDSNNLQPSNKVESVNTL